MRNVQRLFLSLILVLGVSVTVACQTAGVAGDSKPEPSTFMMPDPDEASTAHGSAYTADSMHYRKPMPSHSDWKPAEFYFKHCSQVDSEKPWFSKTAYTCSGL
jgi:hypothetical protein